MGVQDFVFGHAKLLSIISVWLVIVDVFVINIVVYAISHINFTSTMIMISILVLDVILILGHLHLGFMVTYCNFFEDSFLKGVYMIALSCLILTARWWAFLLGYVAIAFSILFLALARAEGKEGREQSENHEEESQPKAQVEEEIRY